jgi:hypothetical protein
VEHFELLLECATDHSMTTHKNKTKKGSCQLKNPKKSSLPSLFKQKTKKSTTVALTFSKKFDILFCLETQEELMNTRRPRDALIG